MAGPHRAYRQKYEREKEVTILPERTRTAPPYMVKYVPSVRPTVTPTAATMQEEQIRAYDEREIMRHKQMQAIMVEEQIRQVYQEAPIKTVQYAPGPGPEGEKFRSQQFYAPTPEQEAKIVSLAEQLPSERREKYVTYTPVKEEPKGIAETLVEIRMEDVHGFFAVGLADIAGLKGEKREQFLGRHAELVGYLQPKLVTGDPMPMFGEPVQTVAGIVAPAESVVYGGERLVSAFVTHHKPVTPRPPPTVTGGLIGAALGSPHELEKTQEYGPSYVAGTIIGDILLSYTLVKTGEKAWPILKKVTPEFVKHPLYQTTKFGRVAKLVHATKLKAQHVIPSFKGSRVQLFLIKHVPRYAKHAGKRLSMGEVALPPLTQPISLGKLKASKLAWELTQFPKTGGVWLTRVGVAPAKTRILPHLISIGGKVSIGYLHEMPVVPSEVPYWQRGLLPFVTQHQVTRAGIIPYIPKVVSATGKKGVGMASVGLLGLVAHAPQLVTRQVPKLKPRKPVIPTPKVWEPTFAYEREKFRPLMIEPLKQKEREKQVLVPHLEVAMVQEQLPHLALVPKVVQRTKQVTIPRVPRILQPPSPTPSPFFPYLPRGGRDVSRRGRGLFGRWFLREHKIATPEQVASKFIGMPRKRRRKRRKGGVLLRF